jgi:hypothetical protein
MSERQAPPEAQLLINPAQITRLIFRWITTCCESIGRGHRPQTIIHDPISATNNRYLELADIALDSGKPKKKSEAAIAE